MLRLVGGDRLVAMLGLGVWLGPGLEVVLGGGVEGVETGQVNRRTSPSSMSGSREWARWLRRS